MLSDSFDLGEVRARTLRRRRGAAETRLDELPSRPGQGGTGCVEQTTGHSTHWAFVRVPNVHNVQLFAQA